MKLSCLQENLNEGLSIVSRAVATRTTLPITQHVLVNTDQNRLKLSATNLEIAISTWIGAEIEEEGTITLPARLFTELVGTLPQDTIDLECDQESQESSFTCGRIKSKIKGGDYKEYPPIPTIEDGLVINISSNELKTAINHVVFAAATEESRPVLTGVKIEISNDSVTFAAADGFRLAVYTTKLNTPVEQDTDFIIPAKSLIEIKSKKTEKGLMTLRNISQGKFASSGSQSKDLEAMAESKYRIILYELNKSKDNSALAIRLNSILTNFPNYKKNTEVGYLAARLFTIDKKYNQGIKVYNWLIKTKSKGYIDKSFYGLGFSYDY